MSERIDKTIREDPDTGVRYAIRECPDPKGLIVGGGISGFGLIASSPVLADFVLIAFEETYVQDQFGQRVGSYFRCNRGHFTHLNLYTTVLSRIAAEMGIPGDRIMTWGLSRDATLAIHLGLELPARCILAGGPQIGLLPDLAMARRAGPTNEATHRSHNHATGLRLLWNDILSGHLHNFNTFINALVDLDLRNLIHGRKTFPRIVLVFGENNTVDRWHVMSLAYALQLYGAEVGIYTTATDSHLCMEGQGRELPQRLLDVFEGRELTESPNFKGSD